MGAAATTPPPTSLRTETIDRGYQPHEFLKPERVAQPQLVRTPTNCSLAATERAAGGPLHVAGREHDRLQSCAAR